MAIVSLMTGKTTINCSFCQKEHTSANCFVVTDIEARKQILRKQGRRFLCLKRNHIARDCESRCMCKYCSGKHHVSLCNNSRQSLAANSRQSLTTNSILSGPMPSRKQTTLSSVNFVSTHVLRIAAKLPSVENEKQPEELLHIVGFRVDWYNRQRDGT
jgi:hypothetical protein